MPSLEECAVNSYDANLVFQKCIEKETKKGIMSKTVEYVSCDDLEESGGQTDGMIRKNALVDVSDKMCSSGAVEKSNENQSERYLTLLLK